MYKRRKKRLDANREVNEAELYRKAADELKNGVDNSESVWKVYEYEENRLSHAIVHTAKVKIRARLRASLILSLLLLEDGYENAAVDNIWKTIRGTRRGLQLMANERLRYKIW
ncbi:MAG: hypothetical protein NC489_43120 [Ruminococcus flavefaciens]|nr:hypothetical protein [Eubacterium sp.]MCM1236915.1 hypothetical protein [Ruminococcus flavefaciens]